MAGLLDIAIEEATQTPQGAELHRKGRRFDELRTSTAWAELREELKGKREEMTLLLGKKALRGVDAQTLRDEGIYTRGWLDGIEKLLDRPDEVGQSIVALINQSYQRIQNELLEATGDQSPYAS
jgi:hypothetical protein